MTQALQILNDEQLAFFAANHYLALEDCMPQMLAERITHDALHARGIDASLPASWPKTGHTNLNAISPATLVADLRDLSPRAWMAACDLVGGEERIRAPVLVTDDLVMNFDLCADHPWQTPSNQTGGWHIDGDFNHFLDSPEIGLLVIILFTDVVERGGATWIATDSILPAAKSLHKHPQGLSAYHLRCEFEFQKECRTFMPLTGPAGRAYLMHPLMLHCVGWNPLRRVRAIKNFGIPLNEPMRFDATQRPLSAVESATVAALGVDRLDFTPPPPELRGFTNHDTGVLLSPQPQRAPPRSRITIDAQGLARLAETQLNS